MIIKKIVIFLLVIIVFSTRCFSKVDRVRVGLIDDVRKMKLDLYNRGEMLYIQVNEKNIRKIKVEDTLEIIYAGNKKVKILNKEYLLPIKLSSAEKISINKKLYEGEIEIISGTKQGFSIVNILSLEKYLYGVVPYEIDFSWTDEMIKVQAIIARTYAISNLNRHIKEGYNFCSTVHCQVYGGVHPTQHPRIKQIIDSTQGLVVVDENNRLVQTYYHATCGGWVEDVSDIWSGVNKLKYLSAKKCDYCKKSPHYEWEYEIDKEKFKEILFRHGLSVGKIVDIDVYTKTATGRVKEIKIVGNKKTVEISANKLRELVGYNRLKSTMFTEIKILPKKILLKGRGWGHGVGLCQWGANYMSLSGKKFNEIIEFYYPKTKIKKYD